MNGENGRTTREVGTGRAVEVAVSPEGKGARATGRSRVAALMVTWNRWEMADRALRAVSRQRYGAAGMDVVVVDNASTDGTTVELARRWRPERIVENSAARALEPAFREAARAGEEGPNAGGFRSLTIIRNAHNLGGCGGFNTAMGYVGRVLEAEEGEGAIDFVWLVDDDIDLPKDALERLERRAGTDERIGIVGSRTVDINDRERTIESTIYFDFVRGRFGDEPRRNDPRYEEHARWASGSGGRRGDRRLTGARDVDVVSACSLLARWSAVKRVGLWDPRYFIYCDDADWCLRFGRAGYRVVCDLDAVVYHTPWNHKLTPQRLYYAQRNVIWTTRKVLRGWALRYAVARWMGSILHASLRAMGRRRLWHAELLRRTARDVALNRGGRLDWEGPPAEPLERALASAGLLREGAHIAVVCPGQASIRDAEALRRSVEGSPSAPSAQGSPSSHAPPAGGRVGVRWTELVVLREGIIAPAPDTPGRRYVRRTRLDRLRTFLWSLRARPDAIVVFDQACPLRLGGASVNVHVDRRQAHLARCERDTPGLRTRFVLRWVGTAVLAGAYALFVRTDRSEGGRSF